MNRLFGSAFRIIAFALAALIFVAIQHPWWTAAVVLVLYFVGRHLLEQDEKRLLELDVRLLSPIEYENWCATRLRQSGWSVGTTARQDQGVDVVAELRNVRAVVQCKKYSGYVGNAAVQQVVAGKRHYNAVVAVVVSPVRYTRSARDLAASNGVHLLHHSQLADLALIARVP